jgi:hypothetical protein
MPHSITRSAVSCLVAVALALSAAQAADLLPPNLPDQGVLILRNGQIIEGRIAQDGGQYVVDIPDGQLRVKSANVEVVCKDLNEGYQRKRAMIHVGNVHDHIELAQWCLQHELLGPAAIELADATVADPNNPMIGMLQRRLKMAVEPQTLPDGPGNTMAGPSNDELDRMIRSLPHGAIETFTQTVQPVLMNHCTASGCHGPQSETPLRLFRSSGNKSASRRITQRNLYSALQFVDMNNPLASRLLTAPSEPHGSARYAVFNEHQALQYKRLVDWVSQLSHQPASESPALAVLPAAIEPPPGFFAGTTPQKLPQDAQNARQLPQGGRSQTVRRGASPPVAKSVGEAAPASYNQPADPHDPEIFNRRYAPEQKPPASKDMPLVQ